ncbi:MAG TPA: ribulose-phosphate 3-epimerase [Clostridiales bacterium]|nr:ribulose-phosphate 3-epimerase [Clostridiales bacterium]
MYEVSTSFLSLVEDNYSKEDLNFESRKESEIVLNLERSKTDYYHIDVTDGIFVEKVDYDWMKGLCSYIKRISNLPLDIHLMVKDVKSAVDDFAVFEPNIISFHYEACKDDEEVMEMINLIKSYNCRVGIAINPDTPAEKIYRFLSYIHLVLVMTVKPGKGGQGFIPEMLNKIEELKKYQKDNNLDFQIEVDGGVNLATCEKVKQAGAEVLVAGTAIINAVDYKVIIDELKKE